MAAGVMPAACAIRALVAPCTPSVARRSKAVSVIWRFLSFPVIRAMALLVYAVRALLAREQVYDRFTSNDLICAKKEKLRAERAFEVDGKVTGSRRPH